MRTTATTQTTNKKKPVQPTCPTCKKQFRCVASKARKFCTTECREASRNAKRRVTNTQKASLSPIFYHWAYEVERAGTLEIFKGHTQESLIQLVNVYKALHRYNGYGQRKEHGLPEFETSHICPVKHPTLLGLYRAENLVVAPKALNRAHGTKYYGFGAGISRLGLSPKHAVLKGTPRKQIIERLIKYLGAQLVADVVKIADIQPSKRHKVVEWLTGNLDPTNKEHKVHIAALPDVSTKALCILQRQLQGKEEVSSFQLYIPEYTDTEVLMLEWERVAKARPDILTALDYLQLMQRMTSHRFNLEFDATNLQLVFDMLHGKDVSHVYPALESQQALVNVKPRFYGLSGSFHSYVVPSEQLLSKAPLVQSAPVIAPKRFNSFAEEVDAEFFDILPQVITAPPTYVEEEEYEFELHESVLRKAA